MFWEFWIFSSLKIITIYEIRVFCSCFWKVKRKTFLLFFSRCNNKERVFNIFPFFFLRVPLSFVLSSFPALRNFMPINFIKLLSRKTFPKHRKFVFPFAHSLCAVNNFSLRSPSHLFSAKHKFRLWKLIFSDFPESLLFHGKGLENLHDNEKTNTKSFTRHWLGQSSTFLTFGVLLFSPSNWQIWAQLEHKKGLNYGPHSLHTLIES